MQGLHLSGGCFYRFIWISRLRFGRRSEKIYVHMQTHDAPADFIFKIWPWLEANRNRLIGGVVAGFVVVGVFSYVSWRHTENEKATGEALTQLIATSSVAANPGKLADDLIQFADKHAGTAAADRAQLEGAALLFNAGRFADAQAQFQKFLSHTSSGTLGATAQIGLAACFEAQGKPEQAIPVYTRVVSLESQNSPTVQTARAALARLQKTAKS
jgi:predicted negative regulator of RcsB-dependent stress response